MRTTLWDKLKSLINDDIRGIYVDQTLILDDIVFRKNLLNHFHIKHHNTIDTYLNYLRKAGYLITVIRGKYHLADYIPIDLSIADVKNEAYKTVVYGDNLDKKSYPLKLLIGYKMNTPFGVDITRKKKLMEFISEKEMQIE